MGGGGGGGGGILKGFSRFVVCLDVQDEFAFKPFPFEYNCIEESYFVL